MSSAETPLCWAIAMCASSCGFTFSVFNPEPESRASRNARFARGICFYAQEDTVSTLKVWTPPLRSEVLLPDDEHEGRGTDNGESLLAVEIDDV